MVAGIAPALISGGLNLLGGFFQGQNQKESIESQEAFQQQMSSSAYSRSVADMKSANLNPALMYGSGGPESSPGGASMTPPNVLGGVANSAMDALKLQRDQDQQTANISLTKAQTVSTLLGNTNTSNRLPIGKLEGDISEVGDYFLPVVKKLVGGIMNSANEQVPPGSKIGSALSSFAPKTGSFSEELMSGLNPLDPYFMSMKDRK